MLSEYQLTNGIINLSISHQWDAAKLEWVLHQIYESEEPETCLCAHFPIKEVCILRNKINGNFVTVGNCCVKKFIGLPSDKIFQAVKRVRKNDEKSLNAEAIQHALDRGWINQWEFDFSIDTMRKRNLTTRQMQTRKKINAKMLYNMKQVI